MDTRAPTNQKTTARQCPARGTYAPPRVHGDLWIQKGRGGPKGEGSQALGEPNGGLCVNQQRSVQSANVFSFVRVDRLSSTPCALLSCLWLQKVSQAVTDLALPAQVSSTSLKEDLASSVLCMWVRPRGAPRGIRKGRDGRPDEVSERPEKSHHLLPRFVASPQFGGWSGGFVNDAMQTPVRTFGAGAPRVVRRA